MSKIQDNDKRIKELKTAINKQLAEMPKECKSFNTNLILTFRDKQYNLHVSSIDVLNELLINLYLYQTAIDYLEIDYSLCGYKVSDWIDDIKTIINNKKQQQRKEQLKSSITKLDSLLSDVAKTADLLDSIEDFLIE